MVKLEGRIKGDRVHEVGYRVFLLRKALELGIKKFNAFNTAENGKQVIFFHIESEQEQLNRYKTLVETSHPETALVSEIAFEDYQGYVTDIVDYMHLLRVEQLSKGIPAILSIDRKQDRMLEKQDETMGKIDQSRVEISGEIRALRDDFRSYFDERLSKVEGELVEIKSKIASLL